MSKFELVHIHDEDDKIPLQADDYKSALEEGLNYLEYKIKEVKN